MQNVWPINYCNTFLFYKNCIFIHYVLNVIQKDNRINVKQMYISKTLTIIIITICNTKLTDNLLYKKMLLFVIQN